MNILFIFTFIGICHTYTISKNFRDFLISRYGKKVAESIYRPDIERSSLGGGNHTAGEKTEKLPIVFVHGLGTRAADFSNIHKHFKENGYGLEELYALTWGTPGVLFTTVHFECKFVLQIRRFLDSVIEFTDSKVDVIGYSMGAPLLRKAILGGKCVDNNSVDIGPSLTASVQTFVSVGGANYGSHLCVHTLIPMCNSETGLHCNSSFIRDINTSTGYEGAETHAIFNPNDEWIGDSSVCKIPPYKLRGAEYHLVSPPSHYSVLFKTQKLQHEIITRKYTLGNFLKTIQTTKKRIISTKKDFPERTNSLNGVSAEEVQCPDKQRRAGGGENDEEETLPTEHPPCIPRLVAKESEVLITHQIVNLENRK